ncbi:hypothetical protein AURDEDRAFT_127239 [Auricularia subglabra TFB-10046 SS5]|nr:hypothetical protein AURDEDRAFT_127239 [Auricularia subglabra TFB-10046 SS5]
MAVQKIETELADTSEIHNSLERALKAAQSAFDESLLRRQQLISRRDAILEDIRQRKRLSCPISALPDDIIRESFVELVGAHRMPRFDNRISLSWERLLLPGRLSSVCRQWNRVAQSTPYLWSYIALDVREDGRKYLNGGPAAFLCRMLHRSGVAPLDIVIDVHHGYAVRQAAKKSLGERRRVLRSIFDTLASKRHRIRTFHLSGGTLDMISGDDSLYCDLENLQQLALGLFRLSTPAIEEIRVELEETSHGEHREVRMWAPYPDRPMPLYLPDAPRLQRLVLNYIPLMCTGRAHPGLPALKVLSMKNIGFYQEHIWEMLALCPSLEEFDVECPDGCDSENDPNVHLPLSVSVASVTMSTGADQGVFNGDIHFPNLTALRLPNFNSCPRFFANIAGTLTSLTITSGLLDADDIIEYAALRNVEHVAIEEAERFDQFTLLEAMDRDTDPMWPRLCSAEFSAVGCYVDNTGGQVLGEWMLELVQRRNARASRDPNVRTLERLAFDEESAASWVVSKLRDILDANNVTVYC